MINKSAGGSAVTLGRDRRQIVAERNRDDRSGDDRSGYDRSGDDRSGYDRP